MKIAITNRLRLSDIPDDLKEILVQKLKFQNPKWLENERMGRWNVKTPKFIKFYVKTKDGGLLIPRGYARRLILQCRHYSVPFEM